MHMVSNVSATVREDVGPMEAWGSATRWHAEWRA